MNIKDFILKEDDDDDDIKYTEHSQRKTTEYIFSLEYENDTDFILKRTSQQTEKLLVVLVSQGQIYIKNLKQNNIKIVSDVSQISNFKQSMSFIPQFKKLTWEPFEQSYYTDKISINKKAFNVLLEHTETVKILANKKVNPLKYTNLVYSYERNPNAFLKQNEFLKIIHLFDQTITPNNYDYELMCNVLEKSKIDYNMIKSNLDLIVELGVNNFKLLLKSDYIDVILNYYNVDFKTFLTYLAYTIKNRNGLQITTYGGYNSFSLSDYVDYLRMQTEMYNKAKEKYPLYWLSEKQITNNKYNNWKRFQSIIISSINQEELKKYEYEDETFKVIVPQLNVDILDEAEQQQHCLASYLDRITQGNTHIVFIRTKIAPEESLLTVEITPEEEIVQIRGFQNRSYTSFEYQFIKNWAKDKNLKLGVTDV